MMAKNANLRETTSGFRLRENVDICNYDYF